MNYAASSNNDSQYIGCSLVVILLHNKSKYNIYKKYGLQIYTINYVHKYSDGEEKNIYFNSREVAMSYSETIMCFNGGFDMIPLTEPGKEY